MTEQRLIYNLHTEQDEMETVHYASGYDRDMMDYIDAHHSFGSIDNGYPLVDVAEYFEESGSAIDLDLVNMEWESVVYDDMTFGRAQGATVVCFVD